MIRRITAGSEHMGERGRAVAELILAQPAKVALLTASKIAQRANVSESTVVRFAQALGYKGYPGLRRDLQEHVRQYLDHIGRMNFTPAPTRETSVAKRSLMHDLHSVEAAIESLSQDDIDTAVKLIGSSRRVYVIGMRSVFGLADMFAFHLRHLVDQPMLIDPAHGGRLDQLAGISSLDLVIAISFPRYSRMVYAALQIAEQQDAKRIVITDSALSPLAPLANVLFPVACQSAFFSNSMMGAMAIVNALLSELSVAHARRAKASFKAYDAFLQATRTLTIDGDENSLS